MIADEAPTRNRQGLGDFLRVHLQRMPNVVKNHEPPNRVDLRTFRLRPPLYDKLLRAARPIRRCCGRASRIVLSGRDMNHPFVDGNKRVGHAAMETFPA